jgi:transcriptional regulator of acetoin/glycerol metabolism
VFIQIYFRFFKIYKNSFTTTRYKLQYRKKYGEETLLNALHAVITGKMSQTHAARVFGVPQQTIFSRLKKMRANNK